MMKQTIKFILAFLSIAFSAANSSGQILGKIYQLGDTIILDGIPCLVYKVDETGMHGTAMSPCAKSAKELEKIKKTTLKRFEKEINKGKATRDDMNIWLDSFRSQEQIPVITIEKGKGGKIYRVDEWSKQVPSGWRIPSIQDAEDFATFYCGGLGKDNGIKYKFINKANNLTTDPLSRSNLVQVAFNGIIISDSDRPADVKFLQRYSQKMSGKDWFEINEKFIGNEKTVAVKDF